MEPTKIRSKLKDLMHKYASTLPRKEISGKQVINFDDSPTAVALLIYITVSNKVLLVKRSEQVSNFQGKWYVVAGFYDEEAEIEQKVAEELEEELTIKLYTPLKLLSFQKEPEVVGGKQWYVLQVKIDLPEQPQIKLNWENVEYKWCSIQELDQLDVVEFAIPRIKNILQGN